MNTEREAAAKRLGEIVVHLMLAKGAALISAAPGAVAKLAVIAKNPDGSGTVGASFDFDDFVRDLDIVAETGLMPPAAEKPCE